MDNKRGLVPRKIKGFRDIDANLNELRWNIINKASKVYQSYGFEHLDTPILEYAECLGKYMPDEDTVDKGVYSFKNPEIEPVFRADGKRELRDADNNVVMDHAFLSMRYDLTAPLSRVYAERLWTRAIKNQLVEGTAPLFRRYQFGPVFRYETKLDPGRFRQFWQLDFDTVGSSDVASDAEVCMILSDALKAIGLAQSDFKIRVNNRKILKGFLHGQGITTPLQEQAILRVIDKLDKIGLRGVEFELGKGRKDKSGAIIPGLGLDEKMVSNFLSFFEIFSESDMNRGQVIDALAEKIGNNEVSKEGLQELNRINSVLAESGLSDEAVLFDPTLVRGMAYYTGPIFEVESTQFYLDHKGRERRVGSICGGGRYDGLVKQLLGVNVPATGASIGVDRLAELLTLTNRGGTAQGPLLITVLDKEMMPEYQKIAKELREGGVNTEVYYGPNQGFKKLKKQLTYADDKNCPIVILLGSDEFGKGVVSVRDLKMGREIADEVTDKKEWRARVQHEVSRTDLVSFVNKLLNKDDPKRKIWLH